MEIFTTLKEAQVLIEQWRYFYNTERPHSSLGYRPPAPKAILPPGTRLAYAMERASLPLVQTVPDSSSGTGPPKKHPGQEALVEP